VKSPLRALLALFLAVTALSCARRETAAPSTGAAPSANAKRYELRGIVRGVDAAKREVTVEHEEIAGYMDAMTMSFPVRDDPQVFEILKAGDRLEAKLVVDEGDYWIEGILTKGFVATAASGTPAPLPTIRVITPEPNRSVAIGDVVPDFTLTDQTGQAVRLSEMRGEPVAVTFIYTRCPIATACPLTTTRFAKLDSMLAAKRFGRLFTISVEPERDTPKVLAEYASHVRADPARWKFLTGDPKAVADVASRFGVLYYPDAGQVVHAQAVAVVDASGRLATIYYGENWEAEAIFRDLEKARKG
jgi:protein SCO1